MSDANFAYEAQDPLRDAVVSLSLKKARNIWIVNMRAEAKGFLPGSEQFATKLDEDLGEIHYGLPSITD